VPVTTRAAAVGLAAALALMVTGMALPAVFDWNVHVRWFPPLHAEWEPRLGWGTVPAVVIGALAIRYAIDLTARLSWGRVLLATYAAGLAWMLALALVDGVGGVGDVLDHPYEYLRTARATDDLPHTIDTYISRIPADALPSNWPVHIAGHPPGALTFFVLLVRVGLGSGLAAGLVVTLVSASTAVAVLQTMRVLGAADLARRAAPFLVIGPAAVWQSVSADAMFAAWAAWAMCALALGATRPFRWQGLAWSVLAGLLLGWCVMCSYGLPLLGLLALAVLVVARSWRPLVPAVLAAVAVVLAFVPFGYTWWEALPVLRERYWDGVAGNRPPAHWMWGNLSALAFSAGPLAFAGVAHTLSRRPTLSTRVAWWLVLGGVAMAVAADLSQMSRAEVERIWLPFVPWLLVGCALLPERWRRSGLALQVLVALLVQHLLFTGW
jgi:hypothetical protein